MDDRLSPAIATDAERQARIELAAAYRLVAREGLDDGIWNHLSLALPGRDDRFLLKPHGLLFGEVTASALIVVDLDGRRLAGEGLWEPTAFYIHARIHRARPDLKCVMHGHMPHLAALAACEDQRLLPLSQDSLRFHDRLAYYDDYNGLALDEAEGDRMVAALGARDILILANHGVLVGARSVAEALYDLHYLELACRLQMLARQTAGGGALRLVAPDVAARTVRDLRRNIAADAALHLAAHMRLLDREQPDYRT
jgi:ribulose-5-phosphate 4-epimerase/fuculose-1-phosphate aldolase